MRSVGVDVAGGGIAAVALATNGKPSRGTLWKPDKKDTFASQLKAWADWLDEMLESYRPDVVAVEELAVFMNKKVIRALSKFEGVALLQAKKYGSLVVNPPVSQARSIVFRGQGVRSKEDAWETFMDKFPGFKLPAATNGGMDIADAMVHALAAPIILERRK